MMKPFEPDQLKTFRPPKYTGISLSLLSMFVLTAMIVVWDKVSNPSETQHSILVLAEQSLKVPLNKIAEQFQNEIKVKVEYIFCESDLLENLEYNQSFDLIISLNRKDLNKNSEMLDFFTQIQIAEKKSPLLTVDCKINNRLNSNSYGLLFSRYLAAEDKGQTYFKKHNLELKESDPWDLNPSITIYCEKQYQSFILPHINNLEKQSEIEVNILFPDQKKLIPTLIAISQSKSQNLLPDILMVSPNTASKISPNYIPVYCKNDKLKLDCLVRYNSNHKSLSRRFLNYLNSNSEK